MYHPAAPPAGNTNDADNFEYVEVKNIGSTPLNLQRFRLSDGVQFEFPNMMLNAGQSGVVVADLAAFQSRYGSGPLVLGQDWLLEMIRTESGRTHGFFWAPFCPCSRFSGPR